MASSYPVLHQCPVCRKTGYPAISAAAIDFICPACREGELVQVEFPETKPVFMSGRWGWIAGFATGTIVLVVLQAGLDFQLGALGIVMLLALASLFGEAALPQRPRHIAGSERVSSRADHDRLSLLAVSAPGIAEVVDPAPQPPDIDSGPP